MMASNMSESDESGNDVDDDEELIVPQPHYYSIWDCPQINKFTLEEKGNLSPTRRKTPENATKRRKTPENAENAAKCRKTLQMIAKSPRHKKMYSRKIAH